MAILLDKADWQYESAKQYYCEKQHKDPNSLTNEDADIIWECAANHIAFFLTWLIRRGFIGEMHCEDDEEKKDLEAVRKQEKTGMDIFRKYCDMKFTDEDVSDTILSFVEQYYESDDYLADYSNQMGETKILATTFSWDDYLKVEAVIDQAYLNFQKL